MKRQSKQPGRQPARGRRFTTDCISSPAEIARIENFLLGVNDVARLDDGTFHRLLVATTEAVNNGILHGNKSDPKKKVCVECVLVDDSIVVRVKDEGKGFNPARVPNPLDEKNLMKESGRGIFLMRTMMDHVTYHISRNGTIVEMVLDLKNLR